MSEQTMGTIHERGGELQQALLNKLEGFLDKVMAEAGLLVEQAGETLRQLLPNAAPWPNLTLIKPLLQQVVQHRQQHPHATNRSPHLPNHFPFLAHKSVRRQEIPRHLQLRLSPDFS